MTTLERFRHPVAAVLVALILTLPWIGTFVSYGGYGTVHPGENITPITAVGVAGLAILGAAFLLAWAAETTEKDVPQAFAIAVLAVLAVAPQYAVDALYAWEAGTGSMEAANLAVANMISSFHALSVNFSRIQCLHFRGAGANQALDTQPLPRGAELDSTSEGTFNI